jgi:hypothetical protein
MYFLTYYTLYVIFITDFIGAKFKKKLYLPVVGLRHVEKLYVEWNVMGSRRKYFKRMVTYLMIRSLY